ncbi:fucolectin-like [Mantella aurantiaca]
MVSLHLATFLWFLSITTAQNVQLPPPGEDIALRGRATQSSTFIGTTNAINAIDGNMDSNMYHGSCSSTNLDTSPWWRVDLLRPHKISQIVITNRGDCCGERLDGASILIGNSLENNGNNNQRCSGITSIPNGATQSFQCNNMVGRYVNIILPGKFTYLTLCEVQVFGVPEKSTPFCP